MPMTSSSRQGGTELGRETGHRLSACPDVTFTSAISLSISGIVVPYASTPVRHSAWRDRIRTRLQTAPTASPDDSRSHGRWFWLGSDYSEASSMCLRSFFDHETIAIVDSQNY
jgi:hypothetical protein